MQWGIQVLPEVIVVRMFNSLDHDMGAMFEKAAERATALDNRKVFVDFSDVESLDGLGLMLCAYGIHHLRQLNLSVALIRPPASLIPVLRKHGMHEVPSVFSNLREAHTLN